MRSRGVIPLNAGGTADEVFGKVKGIVASQLGVEETQVVPTASFTGDLGADSLDTVELIMALEEGFDVSFPPELSVCCKCIAVSLGCYVIVCDVSLTVVWAAFRCS